MTEEKQFRDRIKVVDSREPAELRTKLLEVGWQQKELYAGDYWFFTGDFKRVGIERKEFNDLLSSIGDKLTRQLETSLDHYDYVVLLIEGNWRAAQNGNVISSRGIE